tara:strand:+ start:1724 stop:1945 length:222 start_codon:yes stop_codon:yes gene_type:complete
MQEKGICCCCSQVVHLEGAIFQAVHHNRQYGTPCPGNGLTARKVPDDFEEINGCKILSLSGSTNDHGESGTST